MAVEQQQAQKTSEVKEFACLICDNKEMPFVSVSNSYGRLNARDAILEICGKEIMECLSDEDLVCVTCMEVLSRSARLLRNIHDRIIEHATWRSACDDKLAAANPSSTRGLRKKREALHNGQSV